jgi:hypothetical protein
MITSKQWLWLVTSLSAVVIGFYIFLQSGWLFTLYNNQYLSPDETAYAHFASQGIKLALPDSAIYRTLTQWYSPLRTTVVNNNFQIPVGFAGWPA